MFIVCIKTIHKSIAPFNKEVTGVTENLDENIPFSWTQCDGTSLEIITIKLRNRMIRKYSLFMNKYKLLMEMIIQFTYLLMNS